MTLSLETMRNVGDEVSFMRDALVILKGRFSGGYPEGGGKLI